MQNFSRKAWLVAPLAVAAAFSDHGHAATRPAAVPCSGAVVQSVDSVRARGGLSGRQERAIANMIASANASPGVAVAIVRDGRLVFARGFGFRNLEDCALVTIRTRFYLKSTTKTFLGAAAAALHEKGEIELDAPISDYLPALRLPDGLSARQVCIRDHLTHAQPYFDAGLNYRTAFPGNLPEADFVAHANAYSRSGDIRFRYTNFGPIMAAHAIGVKTGRNWREIIEAEIFAPAGMNDSFSSMGKAQSGEMASGYIGGAMEDFRPALTKTDSQMHAAGGTVSTAADLARWLILVQGRGAIDGVQRLPKRVIEQVEARQIQLKSSYREYGRFAYGLGLYSGDYEGDLLMHHFGGETHVSYMPERGIGVIVLANDLSFGDAITHHVASTIYDMLLGRRDVDARIERRLAKVQEEREAFNRQFAQYVDKQRAAAPLGAQKLKADRLLGVYDEPRLGRISIVRAGDSLAAEFGALSGSLTHVSGDGWLADIGLWGEPPELFVFREDAAGGFILDWGGRIFARQQN